MFLPLPLAPAGTTYNESFSLGAIGGITEAAALVTAGSMTLGAIGGITDSGALVTSGSISLGVIGGISDSGLGSFPSSMTLGVVGDIAESSLANYVDSISFGAVGGIAGAGVADFPASFELGAIGEVANAGLADFPASFALGAIGDLAASGGLSFEASFDLDVETGYDTDYQLTLVGSFALGVEADITHTEENAILVGAFDLGTDLDIEEESSADLVAAMTLAVEMEQGPESQQDANDSMIFGATVDLQFSGQFGDIEVPVFRFGYYTTTDAIDSGPDWLSVQGDAQAASPITLSVYEEQSDAWWEWTNASDGSIHASVKQSRYPPSSDYKKWGQFQNPAYYPSKIPSTVTVDGLDAGNYRVVIYAREHWAPYTNPGQRVFTISVNGGPDTTVDLVDDFGAMTVGATTIDTEVDASGEINITFTSVVEAPTWDAVEILRIPTEFDGSITQSVSVGISMTATLTTSGSIALGTAVALDNTGSLITSGAFSLGSVNEVIQNGSLILSGELTLSADFALAADAANDMNATLLFEAEFSDGYSAGLDIDAAMEMAVSAAIAAAASSPTDNVIITHVALTGVRAGAEINGTQNDGIALTGSIGRAAIVGTVGRAGITGTMTLRVRIVGLLNDGEDE